MVTATVQKIDVFSALDNELPVHKQPHCVRVLPSNQLLQTQKVTVLTPFCLGLQIHFIQTKGTIYVTSRDYDVGLANILQRPSVVSLTPILSLKRVPSIVKVTVEEF
jgi:hypothetical protein